MTEQNKTICRQCNQLKDRIQDGFYFNGKDKRWRDETGKLWSGKLCPVCNASRSKEQMVRSRVKKREIKFLEKTIAEIKKS